MRKIIALLLVGSLCWCAGFFKLHEHAADFARKAAAAFELTPVEQLLDKYSVWTWEREYKEPLEQDELLADSEEGRNLLQAVLLKRAQSAAYAPDDPDGDKLRAEFGIARAKLAKYNIDEIDRRIAEFNVDLETAAEIERISTYKEIVERIGSCLEAAAERRGKEFEIIFSGSVEL